MRRITEKFSSQTNSFMRFLLVGVLNTMIGLSVTFIVLHGLGQGYWMSTFIGNCVGAICSFILNRAFTFRSDVSYMAGGIRFIAVILLCYFIAYSLSPMLARSIPSLELLSKKDFSVLMGAVLYTVFNYLGQRYIVFGRNAQPS
ncbi:GtrA family protein [Robertmurraya andreesenii]|nr:GtrA family protein [Robertmurraya andreesenii]